MGADGDGKTRLNEKPTKYKRKPHVYLIVNVWFFFYDKSRKRGVIPMWIYGNPNPYGKHVGDCTVRAIANATGRGWYETYFALCLQGAIMCDMPSSNAVTTAYLKRIGFRRRTIPDNCPECYCVEDFCADHPNGTFVIGTGSHLLAVIDGKYCDSWESGRETPVYYFEKTED